MKDRDVSVGGKHLFYIRFRQRQRQYNHAMRPQETLVPHVNTSGGIVFGFEGGCYGNYVEMWAGRHLVIISRG